MIAYKFQEKLFFFKTGGCGVLRVQILLVKCLNNLELRFILNMSRIPRKKT